MKKISIYILTISIFYLSSCATILLPKKQKVTISTNENSTVYINKEEVPAEVIEKEIEIETERLQNENKPEEIRAKILQGKLLKYYGEVCLLLQPYAKDDSMTVADVITHVSAKVGEKIVVKRFTRFAIGS